MQSAISHHFWSNPTSVQNIYIVIKGGGRLKSCLNVVACRRRDRWLQESGSGDVHRSRDSRFYILSRDRGEGGSKQPGHAISPGIALFNITCHLSSLGVVFIHTNYSINSIVDINCIYHFSLNTSSFALVVFLKVGPGICRLYGVWRVYGRRSLYRPGPADHRIYYSQLQSSANILQSNAGTPCLEWLVYSKKSPNLNTAQASDHQPPSPRDSE